MKTPMRLFASFIVLTIALGACSSESESSMVQVGQNGELDGVFIIDQGICGNIGPESGSHFRMIEAGGNPLQGPYVTNFDSMCPDQSYSLLSPGTVGFRAGTFQKKPRPAFDAATNGLASEIIGPTRFYSVNLALSSEDIDPLSGKSLPPPTFTAVNESNDDNSVDWTLKASLKSLFIAWNGEYFEQGSPHPDGFVGATTSPRGSINIKTGRFFLKWSSQVVGGSFDGYIGEWFLQGNYVSTDSLNK